MAAVVVGTGSSSTASASAGAVAGEVVPHAVRATAAMTIAAKSLPKLTVLIEPLGPPTHCGLEAAYVASDR